MSEAAAGEAGRDGGRRRGARAARRRCSSERRCGRGEPQLARARPSISGPREHDRGRRRRGVPSADLRARAAAGRVRVSLAPRRRAPSDGSRPSCSSATSSSPRGSRSTRTRPASPTQSDPDGRSPSCCAATSSSRSSSSTEIEAMHRHGARRVRRGRAAVGSHRPGPRRSLGDREHLAVAVDRPGRSGPACRCCTALAALATEGVRVESDRLFSGRQRQARATSAAPTPRSRRAAQGVWLVDGGRARPAELRALHRPRPFPTSIRRRRIP